MAVSVGIMSPRGHHFALRRELWTHAEAAPPRLSFTIIIIIIIIICNIVFKHPGAFI
jgi:hypothetical protein